MLKKRIFLRTSILLLGLVGTISVVLTFFSVREHRADTERSYHTVASALASEVGRLILWDDRVAAQQAVDQEVEAHSLLEYAFVVRNNKVYVDTYDGEVPSGLLHLPGATGTDGLIREFRDSGGAIYVDIAVQVPHTDAVLRIGLKRRSIDQIAYPTIRTIAAVSLLALLAGLAISYLIASRATEEITLLSEAIHSYSEEGGEARFDTGNRAADSDELARSFRTLVADRKRAEEERERTRAFMQTVIDGIPDGLMVINRDYSVALKNNTVRTLGSTDGSGFAAQTCHQISHGSDTPCEAFEHSCPLHQVIETKEPVVVEHTHYDQGRGVPVEVVAAPIFDEHGDVVQIIESSRDISDRKVAEDERLDLQRQVQHAQKLESLGVLAGGIAHDFNNILASILGNANLAAEELPPDSGARDSILEIEKATIRAAGLAKEMLAYSGKGLFVIESIDLNALVGEMAQLLEVSISKKVVLEYDFAVGLPTFEGDATQIRQVIMNLITNASEAMGDKSGTITLSTGSTNCDRACLDDIDESLRAGLDEPLVEGPYLFVQVVDTGCGMHEATIKRIFDPFFTTGFTGRGLGLSATLGIVRSHKGAIKIHSEVGEGTTFKVLFPASQLTKKDGWPARERHEEVETEWQGRGVVLVVDDEEKIRDVVERILTRIGFEVLTARDGQEGLEVFREHADRIVCVLLDLTMPKMDGEETFHKMRSIRSDVKVILCSGYSEQNATVHFVDQGLAGFLEKPYSLVALREQLRAIL